MASQPAPERSDTGAAERAVREHLRTQAALPGSRIGPYCIHDEIGGGGMGVVYSAETLGTPPVRVAVKVMRPDRFDDSSRRRFEFEAQALAAMDHEVIAKIHGAGVTEDGDPYLAMELVEGVEMTRFCDEHRLPIADRLRLFQRVCAGVDHAHRRLVIHRDLKPGNVLVANREGQPFPKIIDFGIARTVDHQARGGTLVTEDGRIGGTREYMSPEQASGRTDAIDTRTDVWALGVMLYELLTGELPFPSAHVRQLGWAQFERVLREETPPRPSTLVHRHATTSRQRAEDRGTTVASLERELRRDLDWIVQKAIAKEPEHRYSSAAELAADLDRYLEGQPVLAGSPSLGYRVRKLVRRHRGATVGATVAFASLLLASGWFLQAQAGERTNATIREQLARAQAAIGVDELVRAVETEAMPETSSNIAELQRWLATAAEARSRLPVLLTELRQRADAIGTNPSDYAVRSIDRLQETIEAKLGDAEHSWQHRIARGQAWAAGVDQLTCEAHADAWLACGQRVAADERFAGVALPPQSGLVPLGPDPDSRFEEFAFLRSGKVPLRDASTGRLQIDADSAIVLVLLPGGTFQMGARPGEPGAGKNEGPLTDVQLDPFFLGKHEVTQGQWTRLDERNNPSVQHPDMPPDAPPELQSILWTNPVEGMTWFQAWHLLTRMGLGLPTEAQWEYAARAGTETTWWPGNDRELLRGSGNGPPAGNIADGAMFRFPGARKDVIDWPDFEDGHVVHAPIGSFRPNPWGLHDMIGNVREWALDEPGNYEKGVAPGTGKLLDPRPETRVSRGGSFAEPLVSSRAAHRNTVVAAIRLGQIGVRAARTLDRVR